MIGLTSALKTINHLNTSPMTASRSHARAWRSTGIGGYSDSCGVHSGAKNTTQIARGPRHDVGLIRTLRPWRSAKTTTERSRSPCATFALCVAAIVAQDWLIPRSLHPRDLSAPPDVDTQWIFANIFVLPESMENHATTDTRVAGGTNRSSL